MYQALGAAVPALPVKALEAALLDPRRTPDIIRFMPRAPVPEIPGIEVDATRTYHALMILGALATVALLFKGRV